LHEWTWFEGGTADLRRQPVTPTRQFAAERLSSINKLESDNYLDFNEKTQIR